MNAYSLKDSRATSLLSRVGEDVSLLRQDLSNLVSHAARQTLPTGARDLADHAKNRFEQSKLYTAEQLRSLGNQVNKPATAWIGGAVLVGCLAAGAYLYSNNRCEAASVAEPTEDV
ncbi:MAG: hypothetical protein ABI600_09335 [Luteolibacter sp.]